MVHARDAAPAGAECAAERGQIQSTQRQQCFPFPGIGPAAESNPATIRIKYGINPGISGICPIPAAESKVGYIPPFWHATVARPCVFVRAESMPKAAKPGLGKSHLSDLVQCTLNGSAQRPSPEEHRARPAATVPAQANRRREAQESTTSRPAASSRASGGNQPPPSQQSSQHTREGRPWRRHR